MSTLHLALLGCGQIGGSLALALKASGEPILISGYDAHYPHAERLEIDGAIDRIASSAADAVKDADIVLLAVPLRSYVSVVQSCADALKPHAIVTDVGSVKQTMLTIKSLLPKGVVLVPGHPISGSEKTGAAAARGDLYKEKLCVLTPEDGTDEKAVAIVRGLWEAAGAIVREMPVAVHDQLYAYVSHLPHVIAFASARQFHRLGCHILPGDDVLARYLRISRSNPRMWADVFIENRDALTQALTMYLAVVTHMLEELRSGEQGNMQADKNAIAKATLPRLLASALISTVSLYETQSNVNVRAFGAGGLRDIASPAADAPEAATEFISQHAGMVGALLEESLFVLQSIQKLIQAKDESGLFEMLSAIQHEAVAINEARQ